MNETESNLRSQMVSGTTGEPSSALRSAAKHRARLPRLLRALFDGSRSFSMARFVPVLGLVPHFLM